jgi:MarR family transcriptional regulator, organic hydroperoxide resistance regulator
MNKPRSKQIPPSAARKTSSRADKMDLALGVLGKFREVFRAAKVHFGTVHKAVGVSGAQLWALWELHREPGLRVTELASRLSLRQSTVSNLIEQLSKAKHLKRKRNDTDQRVVRLYLTASGRRLVESAPQPARGVLPDALESLDAKTLGHLDVQLRTLLRAMKIRVPGASKTHLDEA